MAEMYNKEREEDSRREPEESFFSKDECSDIKDPVRRTFCKVCQKPVIGQAPFCKDHEAPVP